MKEGHPSSHSQLLEGIYNFYDKKVNPIARTNSTSACSDCLALTKLTGADPGFFQEWVHSSLPTNHIVFFAEYQLY